jgi:hypothetical protein
MNLLRNIKYSFPQNNSSNLFNGLKVLFHKFSNYEDSGNQITINTQYDGSAAPSISFALENIQTPTIVLDTDANFTYKLGNIILTSKSLQHNNFQIAEPNTYSVEQLSDNVGNFIKTKRLKGQNIEDWYVLTIEEFIKRLGNNIRNLDHTGLVLPHVNQVISLEEWIVIKDKLSKIACMYEYPDEDYTTFILPVTQDEFISSTIHPNMGRKPRFEFRYLGKHQPLIDIDLNTDLTKEEVEKILPAPYGFSLPGLEHWFRCVHIQNPWSKITLSFAVRFQGHHEVEQWDNAELLLSHGRRVE